MVSVSPARCITNVALYTVGHNLCCCCGPLFRDDLFGATVSMCEIRWGRCDPCVQNGASGRCQLPRSVAPTHVVSGCVWVLFVVLPIFMCCSNHQFFCCAVVVGFGEKQAQALGGMRGCVRVFVRSIGEWVLDFVGGLLVLLST